MSEAVDDTAQLMNEVRAGDAQAAERLMARHRDSLSMRIERLRDRI